MLRFLAAASLMIAAPAAAQIEQDADSAASEQSMQQILERRTDDVVAVLNGELEAVEVFAPEFLNQIPVAQLLALKTQLEGQFGPLEGVQSVTQQGEDRGAIILRFENALGSGGIAVDSASPHLVTELLLTSFEAKDDSVAKVQADLEQFPGQVGVLFTSLANGSEPLLAVNADRQFAIGSTFKLYILSALARSIENGERNWSDVITLNRKSFPSGRMQDWPDGAPVTLHTLATLMISISDNTATDLLLHELGRDVVEAELLSIGHSEPTKTLPFLSTLEMFALKGSEENMRKYIAADAAGKRRILADFEDDVAGNPNLITPPRFVEPTEIETIEWFASGRDLQKLAQRLSQITDPTARSIMQVSTALPDSLTNDWLYVGYKGGSEPGVLNLTWLLQDEAEQWHILSLSWNNPDAPLEPAALRTLAQRLLPMVF